MNCLYIQHCFALLSTSISTFTRTSSSEFQGSRSFTRCIVFIYCCLFYSSIHGTFCGYAPLFILHSPMHPPRFCCFMSCPAVQVDRLGRLCTSYFTPTSGCKFTCGNVLLIMLSCFPHSIIFGSRGQKRIRSRRSGDTMDCANSDHDPRLNPRNQGYPQYQ